MKVMRPRGSLFCALFIICAVLFAEEPPVEKPTAGGFFLSLGENIASNALLHLAVRLWGFSWAQVTPEAIWDNLTNPWEWDRDEYITNQFGHPYQGSVYHAAARSNGFNFFEAGLFDVFGSAAWELFAETNAPSINDLISTTLGGMALGEMFHRLYLETPGTPLGALISPMDTFNDFVTGRRTVRRLARTNNMYRLKLAFGIGYTYAEQSVQNEQQDFVDTNTQHLLSGDVLCNVVYGDPFLQDSRRPYDHFEMTAYINAGYPFWYNLKLLSDAYLFSFTMLNTEIRQASTGLSLHYDLFADRQIDFFSQGLDWTYKGRRMFDGGTVVEFKQHIGWTIFSADAFYIHNSYAGLRANKNNYGTGVNLKLSCMIQTPRAGTIELKLFTYETFNVFQNENQDSGRDRCMFYTADYSFPLGKNLSIGIALSSLWHRALYDHIPDIRKMTHDGKLYIAFVQ